jgi:putative transposase
VRDWKAKLTPVLAENLRRRRKGKIGPTGTLMRHKFGAGPMAVSLSGDRPRRRLVDVMLSEHRDLAAARVLFRSAKAVTGVTPDRFTTDGHDAYPRSIRTELGKHVAASNDADISTTDLGRTTAASRIGVDRCLEEFCISGTLLPRL